MRTQIAQTQEGDDEQQYRFFEQAAAVADGFDRTAVQPRQHEQHDDGAAHGDDAGEFIRYRTQNRVKRGEIPDRGDMLRRFQRIGRNEVGVLQEETAQLRHVENHRGKEEHEHADADDILDGVVRVERNAVDRVAFPVQVFLDLDASGLLEPTSCSATMCRNTRISNTSGTAMT